MIYAIGGNVITDDRDVIALRYPKSKKFEHIVCRATTPERALKIVDALNAAEKARRA